MSQHKSSYAGGPFTPPQSPDLASWLTVLFRLAVGGVLVYAGFTKAMHPAAEFAAAIEAYKILPASWLLPVAMALPWIELWVGTYLLVGFYTSAAAWIAAALFTIFLGSIGSAFLRHIDLASCGCFGPETLSPHQTLVMDLVLLGCSLFLAIKPPKQPLFSLQAWIDRN